MEGIPTQKNNLENSRLFRMAVKCLGEIIDHEKTMSAHETWIGHVNNKVGAATMAMGMLGEEGKVDPVVFSEIMTKINVLREMGMGISDRWAKDKSLPPTEEEKIEYTAKAQELLDFLNQIK